MLSSIHPFTLQEKHTFLIIKIDKNELTESDIRVKLTITMIS